MILILVFLVPLVLMQGPLALVVLIVGFFIWKGFFKIIFNGIFGILSAIISIFLPNNNQRKQENYTKNESIKTNYNITENNNYSTKRNEVKRETYKPKEYNNNNNNNNKTNYKSDQKQSINKPFYLDEEEMKRRRNKMVQEAISEGIENLYGDEYEIKEEGVITDKKEYEELQKLKNILKEIIERINNNFFISKDEINELLCFLNKDKRVYKIKLKLLLTYYKIKKYGIIEEDEMMKEIWNSLAITKSSSEENEFIKNNMSVFLNINGPENYVLREMLYKELKIMHSYLNKRINETEKSE